VLRSQTLGLTSRYPAQSHDRGKQSQSQEQEGGRSVYQSLLASSGQLFVVVVAFSSVAVAWTRIKNDGEATLSSTLKRIMWRAGSECGHDRANGIIGGTEAVKDLFSHTLSLQAYGTTHYCKGCCPMYRTQW